MDERQFRYTLKAAVDIAVLAHRDQMWGVYPYTTHLSWCTTP